MNLVIPIVCPGMPSTGSLNPQGQAASRKNAASSKRKQSGETAGFTFVDQSADLRSIADKKIVDSDQRHLIRSHVMQKVRKDERIQGKKRPTGRDGPRKSSSVQPTSATPPSLPTPTSDMSPASILINEQGWTPSNSSSPVSSRPSQQIIKIPQAPSQGQLDPFNTLPGGQEVAKITNELITYCFHTFIPMTYPVESVSIREHQVWRIKVLESQTKNSATFFGMMATVAAHQAITRGRHKDLRPTGSNGRPNDLLVDNDFALMKSRALQATQQRIAQNGWDGPTVEAIFSLIGAEQILGNFEEARVHLSALRKFFVGEGGLDPKSPTSNWIPLIDVKGAIGTMGRPLFRLPWTPEPVPAETMYKLYHHIDPGLSGLGSAFAMVDGISSQLHPILNQATTLCRFCQYNVTQCESLTASDYEMFRRKSLELEYDVVSYIYPGSPTDDNQVANNINVIEQIARLAILGITSSINTKVLPSAGVGRALTHFQNLACRDYYANNSGPPSRSTAQFLVWALLIFAQCAYRQSEERYFVTNLAWYSQWAGINSWKALEAVCSSFLYVPAYQRTTWYEIWGKACRSFQPSQVPQVEQKQMAMLPSRNVPSQVITEIFDD